MVARQRLLLPEVASEVFAEAWDSEFWLSPAGFSGFRGLGV